MPRRGRRPIDPDIQTEIERRALQERQTPEEIDTALQLDGTFADRAPSLRTVQRYVKKCTVKDTSGPWTLAGASGGVAALVLPVLWAVMERTEGRVTGFTKKQAQWVVKVRRAAPDMPPWFAWEAAMSYFLAAEKGLEERHTASLDALLSFAPWRSHEAAVDFLEWILRHRPDWVGGRWGIMEGPEATALGNRIAINIEVALRGASSPEVYGPRWETVGREEKSDESPR